MVVGYLLPYWKVEDTRDTSLDMKDWVKLKQLSLSGCTLCGWLVYSLLSPGYIKLDCCHITPSYNWRLSYQFKGFFFSSAAINLP